ncbi:MAG: pyruvate/oxaloacetate carboxyltransferase [Deltaproteobacteria bacterium]|nr:pyruvate/oxaloacetate carboxyltransferase [Deltaproteobacteria bacterium]
MKNIETMLKEGSIEIAKPKKILITDLTARDGQQCKLATRVTTDDLLPLCEKMDKAGLYAFEAWGGATYDVCLRYLKEDPWERLRRIKAVMPNTKIQMLFRGQSIVGYRPRADKVVYKFVEKALKNGITVFRVFDSLNDNRNIEVACKVIKELGGECHAEISYTKSPVHTYEKWMQYADELLEIAPDWISFKDATGIIMPLDTYNIIKGMKEKVGDKIKILFHNHDMSGTAIMNHMMAIYAGVDMLDTVLSPLAFGSSHPATESVVAALQGTPYDTGIDLKILEEAAALTGIIRKNYKKYETEYGGVNAKVLIHKIPGGMISNMTAQLKEANAIDKMEEVLKETPNVEKDLGYPPLLTPSSQIVGVQAVLNVISGERYKMITKEVRDYIEGKYGTPPGPVSKELIEKIMGPGGKPDYSKRPSDSADVNEWDKAVKELGSLAKSDEDILLYVLFPLQAMEFLKARENGELETPEVTPGTEDMIETRAGVIENTAPVEFDVTYHGDKFNVKIEGVTPNQEEGKPRKYYVRVGGKLEEIQLFPKVEAVIGGKAGGSKTSAGGASKGKRGIEAGDVTPPMPGKVAKILVKEGDKVTKGQTVAMVEAMKMENEIHAAAEGTVKAIYVKVGDNITPDDPLLNIG